MLGTYYVGNIERKSWLDLISEEMNEHNDSWESFVSCTLTIPELVVPFSNGYGGPEGEPFCLWTKNRVYFPLEYDGEEGVGSVSREPDGMPVNHL